LPNRNLAQRAADLQDLPAHQAQWDPVPRDLLVLLAPQVPPVLLALPAPLVRMALLALLAPLAQMDAREPTAPWVAQAPPAPQV